jgi:hypothetical protein
MGGGNFASFKVGDGTIEHFQGLGGKSHYCQIFDFIFLAFDMHQIIVQTAGGGRSREILGFFMAMALRLPNLQVASR